MKKLLGICLAFLLVAGLVVAGGDAVQENGLQPIIDYAYSTKAAELGREFYVLNIQEGYVMMSTHMDTHPLRGWRWEAHRVKIDVKGTIYIEFSVRYYQDFSSAGSCGFEEWILLDYNMDGTVDEIRRDWKIVMEDTKGIKGYNTIIDPYYPEGFVNEKWYYPSEKEIKDKYEAELEFWLDFVKDKS